MQSPPPKPAGHGLFAKSLSAFLIIQSLFSNIRLFYLVAKMTERFCDFNQMVDGIHKVKERNTTEIFNNLFETVEISFLSLGSE